MTNLREGRQLLVWAVVDGGLALVDRLRLPRVGHHVRRGELEREDRASSRVRREEVGAPEEAHQLPLALPDLGGVRLQQVGCSNIHAQCLLVAWLERFQQRHTIEFMMAEHMWYILCN